MCEDQDMFRRLGPGHNVDQVYVCSFHQPKNNGVSSQQSPHSPTTTVGVVWSPNYLFAFGKHSSVT
jgi:hypothetical protein